MKTQAPTVAMIGGGQLARMSAPAAAALGVNLRVLVESELASAAQVVADAPVGSASDAQAVRDLVGHSPEERVAVLSFEHAHIPDRKSPRLNSSHVAVSYAV